MAYDPYDRFRNATGCGHMTGSAGSGLAGALHADRALTVQPSGRLECSGRPDHKPRTKA